MPGDGQVATTDLVPPVVATPELEVGTLLADRYRLIARLGRGGGGTVWRAFDQKVGEELALKLIEEGADLERWRREVALARRISHGNVCRVYDLGEAMGLRWVTMERIEGDSLRARLSRGAIAEPERLMRQLVDAVAAIHAAGVVHRDLKPENVVVDGDGRAVVVDFGLARRPVMAEPAGSGGAPGDRTVTGHGAVLGTPRYMAPEQAAGEPADARSDVYALGLVLDEIARGRDGAAEATTVADRPGAPPAPRPVRAALRRPWRPVIARCTAANAADRYPDAVAVRAALASHGRRRRWWQAGAVVAAVAAAGALWAARSVGRAPEPSPGPLVQRRLTTTAATPARQPTSLAVSADGKTLAYAVGLGVMLRPIDGGREQPATMPMTPGALPLARMIELVGFLGEGRAVAQLLDRDQRWELWALGVDQSPQRLYGRDERMVVAVSPRGDQLAVATPSGGLAVVALGGPQRGAERRLVAAVAGERIAGLAWSPAASHVAFVRRVAGGAATLEAVAVARPAEREQLARLALAEPVDRMTAWPAADRVVVIANDAGGAELLAVPVAGAPAVPAALARWPGEHVAELASAGARLVVLRGSAEPTLQVGVVDRRGYVLNLVRGVPEHARAAQLAGWTGDGRLVHAADAEVVVREPDGPATALAAGSPDAVVGDAVIYHRGRALRTIGLGHAGGGDRSLGELPAAVAGDLVRCAGDRAPPCVIAATDGAAVRYLRFDPATGARGDEVYRAAIGPWLGHAMAVSPDGATLAVVDGTAAIALVGLADGAVRREPLPRSTEPVAVSWSHDGASLLVSLRAGGEDRAGVIRLWPGGARQLLLHSDVIRFARADEDPSGVIAAIEVRELALDAWLIDGL